MSSLYSSIYTAVRQGSSAKNADPCSDTNFTDLSYVLFDSPCATALGKATQASLKEKA